MTALLARVRSVPRKALIIGVAAAVACAAAGVAGGRLAAPKAAADRVIVSPLPPADQGDPIVRPERLELPQ